MRLRLKILVGILISVIVFDSTIIIQDLYNKIYQTKIETIEQINSKFKTIENILDQMDEDIGITLEMQSQRITMIPKIIKADKKILENKLQRINIVVYNKTLSALGSGVTLKYKDNYYVLTAGHLAESEMDNLILMENDKEICELEIVKHNYSFNGEDISLGNDLLLLRPKNKTIKPKIYIELDDYEPRIGVEVYIVGNPLGMEDVICDGRVVYYKENFMYIHDNIYYGNSGGGVYTREGKLVGIVSHLIPIQPYKDVPAYMIFGIVRLNTIKSFLQTIE